MTRRVVFAVAMFGLLAGCSTPWSESRLNPFAWFGGSASAPDTLVPPETLTIVDNRPFVTSVTSLAVERTPGGVILRATGLPPTQGFWQGALILENIDGAPVDGTLTFQFRAAPPPGPQPVGAPRTREIVVGVFLSRQNLQGVTTLRVVGQQNAATIRP
jgi:hypothetical protein